MPIVEVVVSGSGPAVLKHAFPPGSAAYHQYNPGTGSDPRGGGKSRGPALSEAGLGIGPSGIGKKGGGGGEGETSLIGDATWDILKVDTVVLNHHSRRKDLLTIKSLVSILNAKISLFT